ncbi:MAG TPA: hypothetical protein VNX68_06490, partial [Nitrosopumilaceae archaeon]|nr:hypothetical protein [Nitrosopumilaceae archaeon]
MAILSLWENKAREKLKKLHDVRAKLALISEEEKGDLEFFFHRLMFRSTFVYTLFGDKPMSFEDLFKEECIWKHYMHAFTSIDYGLDLFALQRGWRVWKKYESFFPLKKFIFIQQEYPDSKHTPSPLGHSNVILIHKDNFLSTMKKYSDDFKKVLGDDFDPHEMLKDIRKSKSLF